MTKQEQRTAEIQIMVCETVAAAVERDMRGDEQIMKEVWESCSTKEHKIAEKEMQSLVELIQGRIGYIKAMAAKTGDCPFPAHAADCECRGEAGDR